MNNERKNVDLACDEEYDRIWQTFVTSSPTLKADWTVLQQSMEENNYIGKSITLLDIGAGKYRVIQNSDPIKLESFYEKQMHFRKHPI